MLKRIFLVLSIFVITSCGGGGGGGGGGNTPTTPSTPLPTVNLSAEPTSVLLESTSTFTWSSTNATSCSASWTNQTSTSGSETVTITMAGNNSYSISCTGAGGSRSATVTVEGYRNTDGVVVDGYISGAEVCIDEDESWTCDSSESSTTSDNDGKFTIKYANGNLVSIGGTDLDSQTLLDNLLITHKLTGHSDFKAVTPVTSVAAFMEDASLVNAALGIDTSIDVFTFDPVASKGDGGINDYLYEKGNQLTVLAYALQNITNNLNTTTETTQDYFKAITEEIEKEYTETTSKVDIETEDFITKTLDNIVAAKTLTITDEAKANTTKALSGVMPVIEVKSSDDLTTSVIRFAVSTLQTDIQAIANGTASSNTITSYSSDVLTYIAEDQSIEANELTPDIIAIADSATTQEDTSVTINVVLNDSYLTSAPVSVSAGNGSNGTTTLAESSPEQIVYTPNADYNGTDTFSYSIIQGDKTSSADVTVTIEAVNDAPSINTASTIQAAENQTAVATISISDIDEDDLTLTLSGTDADSFELSTDNVLTFKEAPDYETKSSYSITLSLTDGVETATKDISIAVTNVNDIAPVFTSEATFSAAENQTAIGTIAATDAEGDAVTFTVSGSELAITSAGVLTFASAPDYETKASYIATITASDGVNSTTQDITVNVINVNDNSPIITSEATFSAAENQTAIGTVFATDADGDGLVYSISGSDIAINNSTGVVAFTLAPDFETKSTYTATVTASDGSKTTNQDITINITNVNEAPIITSSATFSSAENQTSVGTVVASDPEGDSLSFSIGSMPAPTSNGEYTGASINSDGVITLNGTGANYELMTSFSATVTVTDGVNITTQDISVSIINVREGIISYQYDITDGADSVAPRLQATLQFDELMEVDDVVFILRSDAIVAGGITSFTPVKKELNIWSIDEPLNMAANGNYNYYLNFLLKSGSKGSDLSGLSSRTNDGKKWSNLITAFDTQRLGFLNQSSPYISFNNPNADTEAPSILGYILPSDPSQYLNYGEALIITGNDGDESTPITVSITAVFSEEISYATDYNSIRLGSGYYTNTSDADIEINGNTVTYTWGYDSKTPITRIQSRFTAYDIGLNGAQKRLRFDFTNAIADESQPTLSTISLGLSLGSDDERYLDYDLQFDPSDIGTSNLSEISMTLRGPYCNYIYARLHDYNPDSTLNTGQYKGKFRMIDNHPDGIYRISSQVTIHDKQKNRTIYNREDLRDTFSVGSFSINSTANDSEVVPTPTILCPIASTTFHNVDSDENSIGVVSYENTIQDWEGNTIIPRFGLSGDDAALFNISSLGVVTFKVAPDYENPLDQDLDNRYELTTHIYSYDSGNSNYVSNDSHKLDDSFNVDVQNINDTAPVFTSEATFSAEENQVTTTNIGRVTATDVDGLSAITYSISGSELTINDSGFLFFVSAPDYETKATYTATVTATDGTNSTTQAITVNVTDVDEIGSTPVITSPNNFNAAENQTVIGTVTATDADGDSVTFTISGSELAITSAGVLTFAS
ncbi:cadherin domain-containing protein, partial [Gammaproteobacteria bacterium]|nr:cadherin domain-containing protein [Gammaproteobacteria bacterium]